MSDLVFQGSPLSIIEIDGLQYVTATEVARILYRKGGHQTDVPFDPRADDKLRTLYSRHTDEFTQSMARMVRIETPGGDQTVRVFSLRGCHLLGMLARTPVAKEFRRWVLDVLDGQQSNNRELWPRLQTAISELTTEKFAASVYGRGLRRWRGVKPEKEGAVKALLARVQPGLFLD